MNHVERTNIKIMQRRLDYLEAQIMNAETRGAAPISFDLAERRALKWAIERVSSEEVGSDA